MKKNYLVIACFLVFNAAFAQDDTKSQNPKTKLEVFSGQYGRVFIKAFSEVGKIKGSYNSAVKIEAREYTNAADGKKEYGISIEVEIFDRISKSHTSYIDYDEIPSLIKGLEYLKNIDKSVTKLTNFEATYKTKDDLEVSAYTYEGSIKLAVSSGNIGKVNAYLQIEDTTKLIDLLTTAKQKVDSIR